MAYLTLYTLGGVGIALGAVAMSAYASPEQTMVKTSQKSADFKNALAQYYVEKPTDTTAKSQNRGSRRNFDRRHCHGAWVNPTAQHTHTQHAQKTKHNTPDNVQTLKQGHIHAYADSAYVKPKVVGKLIGDVSVTQGEQQIVASEVKVNLQTNQVTTTDATTLNDGDLFLVAHGIRYDLDNKTSSVGRSAFFSQSQQAHGSAKSFSHVSKNTVKLTDVNYTTCPPNNPSWQISASTLALDNDSGRGEAKGAKVSLFGLPALYLPYINFPIDDRRMSGLLTPRVGFTNDGGIDVSMPYYFNLAPNYDATLAPRFFLKRGVMLEGRLRYLDRKLGRSQLSGAYLPQDKLYKHKKSRRYLKLEHDWQASKRMKVEAEYGYVSDRDFFTDLGKNPLVQDELNVPRNVVAHYTDNQRELTGELRIETFQTVDKLLPDTAKPYSRLPQLTLTYGKGDPQGMTQHSNIDIGYFAKRIDDNSSVENSGFRLYGDYTLDYTLARSWGHFRPALSVAALATVFDDQALDSQGLKRGQNDTAAVVIPSASLDAGLVFEKNNTLNIGGQRIHTTQALEPRVYIVYAGKKDQATLPNFDTTAASPSFDQLFTHKRFLGRDRIANASAISLGTDYRIFDTTGLERFNLGLATRYHFTDQHINLSGKPIPIKKIEGYFARATGYILPNLSLSADAALSNTGKHNFTTTQLSWQPKPEALVNLGYYKRANIASSNQRAYRSTTASVVLPVSSRWRVLGHSQFDFTVNRFRDILLGASYESCCYGFALYGRSYYNNLDNPKSDKRRRQVMAELSLKGLGGLSGGLDKLLEQRILGYVKK